MILRGTPAGHRLGARAVRIEMDVERIMNGRGKQAGRQGIMNNQQGQWRSLSSDWMPLVSGMIGALDED